MKVNRFPLTSRPLLRSIGIVALAVVAMISLPQYAPGQTDNFDSGILDPGWATSVSSNYPANLTFVTDVFGGKALRMTATTSALYMYTNAPSDYFNIQNTARAMIWRTNQVYSTNFYIAVDLVGWNTSTDTTTNNAVIGIIARATNVVRDPNAPLGRPDGVFFGTRYQADGGASDGTRGQLNIYGIQDGQPYQNLLTPAAAQGDYTINPGHKYRLVFTGTNIFDSSGNGLSNVYYGRVYDLNDLTRPLATIHGGEPLFPYSFAPWSLSGYSGIFGIGTRDLGSTNAGSCDVTFDNFVAAEYPPTSVSFPGTTNGEAGVAQVVNRTPASYSNFYAPAGGISFTATTLGGGNVTTARLFLNGVDVSSSLNNPAAGSSRSFSFPGSGLTTNTVYDARIELANALGQYTTNAWTFDTFSDAYLASAACKNIECEDFDFNGQFIDNPVASGYEFPTTFSNDTGNVAPPWAGAINQGSSSYVLQGGVNARTNSGVGDFFDYDQPYHTGDNDFRPFVGAGTSEGCGDFTYFDPVLYQTYEFTFDTQRQKYSSVNTNLQEYFLERTEGGEWYDYTRVFHSTNYYNVYLRHGCELTQPVRLDLIEARSQVNNLGTFYLTNALAKHNFRYAPLVTAVTPPNSLIANGTFAANALLFTSFPGYTGGSNPSSITGWTGSGSVECGINGSGTSVGSPFSPVISGGLTYAFLQGTGQALVQHLTTLAPNTTYQLVYSVAGRAGNTASYRVVLYSDNTLTTSYYDSGVQTANSSGFATVNASFTTPATLGSAPNIQLVNSSVAGDNTVDYANVFLVPGVAPVTFSNQLAVVNLSGTNTLRLTIASPQGNATKQGLMLNYMAFVPALVVLSSTQASTGYTLDTTASINQSTRTITIPSGAARYYRLSWDHQTVITSITLSGGNVVLTYQ